MPYTQVVSCIVIAVSSLPQGSIPGPLKTNVITDIVNITDADSLLLVDELKTFTNVPNIDVCDWIT